MVNLGRKRNKVKFNIWGLNLKGDSKDLQRTLKSLKAAAETHKARIPGSVNQALTLQKVSRNKVEVSWPRPVTADACTRVLRLALGKNWRNLVTDPAGVQGADQTAATDEEEVPPPSRMARWRQGTLADAAATAEAEAVTALYARGRGHLLSLKLEAVTALYTDKKSFTTKTCNRFTR